MNFGERKLGGTAVWHTVLGSGLVGIYSIFESFFKVR